jgi:septal ring factor EnvC (AmiA/AmiB activator)|tara:strand:- start:72 stop:560 length:489 start_codon:yes stop_codon:yes gene_type:complete
MGAKLAIVMFLLLLGAGGIGYWYYNDTQARMAILQENNAKLNTAVELNEQTISSLEKDYEKASSELATLNEQYTAIRRQNQRLADKLQEIDLTAAAIANAKSIERAVNRGTVNAGRCFELLSGAELNDKERNAENGIAFNKECPWLYDTYKSRGLLNQTTAD